MKMLPGKRKVSGLTLIEVLMVVAIIAILAAMLLPALSGSRKARIPLCMSNQKQIAIALIMFQVDHNGKYLWQTSTTNNGSLELTPNGLVSDQFSTLAPYLGKQPQVLICPTDKSPAGGSELFHAYDHKHQLLFKFGYRHQHGQHLVR